MRIYEVPISYRGRTYAEGKKIGLKDAFRAGYCILRYGLEARIQRSIAGPPAAGPLPPDNHTDPEASSVLESTDSNP